MTLAEWDTAQPCGRVQDHMNGIKWIPDSVHNDRVQAFDLEDYYVSAVTGGSMWFAPRSTAREYRKNEWINRHGK